MVIPPPPPGLEFPSLSSLTESTTSSAGESIVSDKLEVLDSPNPVQSSNNDSEIWEMEETIVKDEQINLNNLSDAL